MNHDVKVDEIHNGVGPNSNKSQDLEHPSDKNHSLFNENNNSSEFQNKKPPHMLKNALKTLGGFFQSEREEAEEEDYIGVSENIKNAIKNHKSTHGDCGLCKNATKWNGN